MYVETKIETNNIKTLKLKMRDTKDIRSQANQVFNTQLLIHVQR